MLLLYLTYEELTLLIEFKGGFYYGIQGCTLPMRNWHLILISVLKLFSNLVVPYLWGIDTASRLSTLLPILTLYLTYEELTLKIKNVFSFWDFKVVPYLWGIDTFTKFIKKSANCFTKTIRCTLPMRNWHSIIFLNNFFFKHSVVPYLWEINIEMREICHLQKNIG